MCHLKRDISTIGFSGSIGVITAVNSDDKNAATLLFRSTLLGIDPFGSGCHLLDSSKTCLFGFPSLGSGRPNPAITHRYTHELTVPRLNSSINNRKSVISLVTAISEVPNLLNTRVGSCTSLLTTSKYFELCVQDSEHESSMSIQPKGE